MVIVYVGPHTCIPIRLRNDGRMMNCNFIATNILKKLCEDHTTPIKHLRSMIESKYDGHKPSYYKVWDAKQKMIEKIFRNWEESYQRLQKLLMSYVDQDPIISVDGTYLYGKYQGKLLVIMATDANNKVFSLAFAIVDCESGSSWRWFLQCLGDTIGNVIPDEGICIISNRHLGIKNAIAA